MQVLGVWIHLEQVVNHRALKVEGPRATKGLQHEVVKAEVIGVQ